MRDGPLMRLLRPPFGPGLDSVAGIVTRDPADERLVVTGSGCRRAVGSFGLPAAGRAVARDVRIGSDVGLAAVHRGPAGP